MSPSIMIDGVLTSLSDADYAARFPPAPPAGIPQSVTPLQGKLALNAAGLLSQVESTVAAADKATQIWYAEAPIWERQNPIILALAQAMTPPLSSGQLDALFTQAAAIRV